ncbi:MULTISPECIES: GAF domain-containing sensor histidine kinase [unclassified Amycolatopsis]|uniref:sensor histidine kinase n=1 Tax=unclassified Amycolatopsis TaxID=2618356 RepID=UPI001C6949DE|nr:GAF domain-containing sensor histidine kinase [Amycolatopsis sp. DSM 110486]QYN18641.1 GAF domain-containing sensor histidine kinase [Amycolatopsis sp. DSM 110486]
MVGRTVGYRRRPVCGAAVAEDLTADRTDERIAEERAALRRVAALVASAVPPGEVFAAVAAEIGRVVGTDVITINRYGPDRIAVAVGVWTRTATNSPRPGTRFSVDDSDVLKLVHETAQPARIDHVNELVDTPTTGACKQLGSVVGVPISVEGRQWGAVVVLSLQPRTLPDDIEERLVGFTELVATAIANTQARVELRRYADEQAALRRVATLVASAATPEDVFAAVTAEVGGVLEVDFTFLSRFDAADRATIVGAWCQTDDSTGLATVGTGYDLAGSNIPTLVSRTGRTARIDDYWEATGAATDLIRKLGIRSAAGAPISVEGRLWGCISVMSSREQSLPADAEGRLTAFTKLVATALADTLARLELRQYADEQAALRRVATLVARAAPQGEMFTAVATEVGMLLGVDLAVLSRYDLDGSAAVVGGWLRSRPDEPFSARDRLTSEGPLHTKVFQTHAQARIDDYTVKSASGASFARISGLRSAVGVPINVEQRVWGVISVATTGTERLPSNTEKRLTAFTELVGTSLAKAEAQAALRASRARIVTAADTARRRIERDLHDGVQQHLVSLALLLREAQLAAPPNAGELVHQLDGVVDGLGSVLDEIREISRGVHPAVLAEGGLLPALKSLARRAALPVHLDIRTQARFPEPVEIAAYYIVAEALANTAKHANATVIDILLTSDDGTLRLTVQDDGQGGADPSRGSGLVGLTDRVEALGGHLWLHSPQGAGTTVRLAIPLP